MRCSGWPSPRWLSAFSHLEELKKAIDALRPAIGSAEKPDGFPQKYIELNPVRAGMVGAASRYRWSSYGTNGEGRPSELITPHERYLQLDKSPVGYFKIGLCHIS